MQSYVYTELTVLEKLKKIQKLDYKIMLREKDWNVELRSGSNTILFHLTGQNCPQIAFSTTINWKACYFLTNKIEKPDNMYACKRRIKELQTGCQLKWILLPFYFWDEFHSRAA